jgi:hypothetical protein
MNSNKFLLSAWILLVLTACIDLESDDDEGPSEPFINTGVFLDSPVINIGYRTETLEGVTNAQGEYEYLAGETVTFFIGDLELPAQTAKGVVTPLDLAATTDVNDAEVVNIIRLLQTLDKDGNPDNGLTITDAAKSSAVQVDFTLPTDQFASSAAVTNLITGAQLDTPVTELISIANAITHFESQLAITLTDVFLNDRKFIVNTGSSDIESLEFLAGGNGSIKFTPNIYNGFDSEDEKGITWDLSDGTLTFRESSDGADYWDWVLTPIAITENSVSMSITVAGVEDGEVVGASFTIGMTAPPSTILLTGFWTVTESFGDDVCDGGFRFTYSNVDFSYANGAYDYTQTFLSDFELGASCKAVATLEPDDIGSFLNTVAITETELEEGFSDSEIQSIDFHSDNKFVIEIIYSDDARDINLTQVWTRQ